MLYTLICICIAAVIFFAELIIKKHFDGKDSDEAKDIMHGRITLKLLRNRGFAGSSKKEYSPIVGIVSLIVTIICLILFVATLGRHGCGLAKLGLSILLGGAFSNTYERLKKKYVVDYISFNVKNKRLSALVFNIADFCILIGALILLMESAV
jgi:signal peptidase II